MCGSISLKCIPLLSVLFSSALVCKRLYRILPMSTSKPSLMEGVPGSPQVIVHNYFIIPITFERGFSTGRLGTQFHKDSENYGTAGIKHFSRRCGLIQKRECEAVTGVNAPPAYT